MMVHVIVAVLGVIGALGSLAIWLTGGFTVALFGMTIQAHDPFRPLAVALVCAITYIATKGPLNVRRLISPLATLLALSAAFVGISRNSWTAGGADSYAYVSQAELWLNGSLTVPVPLAASAPWPNAVWTFAPHGFRPAVSEAAIVPVTAPGLPLLMAAAKAVAGHCAMFLVTPVSGVLLVWMTFAIGRRVVSDLVGLVAAWLVATSPAVLAMLVSPMSDVPAAALWAAATYFALGVSNASAVAAGLASSGAILIRPNLAPLAAILVVWKLWAGLKPCATYDGATDRVVDVDARAAQGFSPAIAGLALVRPPLLIAAGTIPGCLFIAWINTNLYGSPLASGYGTVPDLFSVSYVFTNLRRYGGWLIESQTPLSLVGIAALLIPAKPFKAVWQTATQQRAAILLGSTVVLVWTLYLIYTPYDAWWFLRFLLPSWPAICVGAAASVIRIAEDRGWPVRIATINIVLLIGGYGIRYASANGAFPSGEGDHRYVSIAKLVEEVADPAAVIFAGQHSGPTRYYAGRTIVRFDLVEPAWIERAAQWLTDHGRPPYFLLEDWEVQAFRQRFASSGNLGAMPFAPVMEYRAPGVAGSIYLFDPARPDGSALHSVPPVASQAKCVGPSPLLHLR